jgi:hypothetical protein
MSNMHERVLYSEAAEDDTYYWIDRLHSAAGMARGYAIRAYW